MSPSTRPHRLVRSRTPGFHPGNRGSNPLGVVFDRPVAKATGLSLFWRAARVDLHLIVRTDVVSMDFRA